MLVFSGLGLLKPTLPELELVHANVSKFEAVTPSIVIGAVPEQTSILGFITVIEGILLIVIVISSSASEKQGLSFVAVNFNVAKPLVISVALGV